MSAATYAAKNGGGYCSSPQLEPLQTTLSLQPLPSCTILGFALLSVNVIVVSTVSVVTRLINDQKGYVSTCA